MNLYNKRSLTAEILLQRASLWDDDDPRQLLVATDERGALVGYAKSERKKSEPAGKFGISVFVHPNDVGKGLGRGLLSQCETFALKNGCTHVLTSVNESYPRGAVFVGKAGFVPVQHLFESRLALDAFDSAPFLAVKPRLEEAGYRFTSFGEEGDTEENWRKLHELDSTTDEDTPGFENWGRSAFEDYRQTLRTGHAFTLAGIHVAVKDGEWVGVNFVKPTPVEGEICTEYTGVLREHRGKGLAQVLKAIGIQYAKDSGADTMSTFNDERNAPMLAVNRKLGFVAQPGFYVYRKELGQ
jgi:GNAT superfamily N-acetyltransferase